MITIVAKSILIEGKKQEFLDITAELIRESRNEKGNKSYNLFEDMNNPDIVTFIEEWEDEEAIRLHNESKHFKSIVPKLAELRQDGSEANKYRRI